MKRRILLAMFAFTFIVPVGIVSAEEVKEEAGQTVVPSEAALPQSKEAVHEEMKQKEHGHDERMHGMMAGHDMKGWWIVIGVVMVIMMGAHVAVLF